MKEIGDVTFLVVDSGLFLPVALRLAEQAKRVIYFNPDRRSFASIKQGSIGYGFENLEHTLDFWPMLEEVDCACFPDIGNAGLQLHLESLGIPVWGSRDGDRIEIHREEFLKILEVRGLDVAPHRVCVGLEELREFLMDKEDLYLKISRWRGDMETRHWRNWDMDESYLDWLALAFGPFKDEMRFLVFDKIDTTIEIGGDTYAVDGAWPSIMLNGLEHKDTTYFSAVTPYKEMPEQLQTVMESLSQFMRENRYRNQFSSEVRVKGDQFYFIDPTCRGGMPSTASQLKCWKNFAEIVWAGANGELIDPDPAAKFTIECMVKSKECDGWDYASFSSKLRDSLILSNCCLVDGRYCFPPDETHSGDLGWLVALGDTPTETLNRAKELADMLPDGLDAQLENLTGLIAEIDTAADQGIPFTEEKIPAPAEVIED